MTDTPRQMHPALEAYRTSKHDTEDTLRKRAKRAAVAALASTDRDDSAPPVQVRRVDRTGMLSTDGDAIARVDHRGEVIAKEVNR